MLGILGNVAFVAGSVLFFKRFEQWYTLAVWLFVVGSSLMLVGALGSGLKKLWQVETSDDDTGDRHRQRTGA